MVYSKSKSRNFFLKQFVLNDIFFIIEPINLLVDNMRTLILAEKTTMTCVNTITL